MIEQGVISRQDGAAESAHHVMEMQRQRLVGATIEVAYEQGVSAVTIGTICRRAGLSRRTFYDIFSDRQGCLEAVFQYAARHTVEAVQDAAGDERDWRSRIRAGLTGLLYLFDSEPGLARFLIVEALSAGERTLQARAHLLEQATETVDAGRAHAKTPPPPLTAEAVVGAITGVLHGRFLQRDPRPLSELAGALTAIVIQPYLGTAAAQRELKHLATIPAPRRPLLPSDPFKDLPIRLTYRTARVLVSIGRAPGSSSRQIADAAGISDQGQVSRLLNRLARTGLIQDDGIGPSKGLPRSWTLTQHGQHILRATGQA